MGNSMPESDEWSRLYQAAIRIKEMAPWEWMSEMDIFGVRNPETDETGYVSIMGALGEHYAVVGPEAMTGESSAQAWGAALGSGVIYAGDDLDAWSQAVSAMMPDWLVTDLRIMFEDFQARGLLASDDDFARQRRLLGRDPIPFARFAAEVAAMWRGQG